MATNDTNLPDFFTDPAVVANSQAYYRAARSICPATREPYHGAVMITGYDAAMEVLNHQAARFSSANAVTGPLPPLPFTPAGDDIRAQLANHRAELPWSDHLVTMDGVDHFDFGRPGLRDHISFSRAAHACIGAPLARMEARITLERFLAGTSDIRISAAEHGPAGARRYDYEPTYLLNGLRALHIEWDAT